jgi:hypothetical protein
MFDAKPLQTGFVLPQPANGFIAFHGNIVANPGDGFHVFRFQPDEVTQPRTPIEPMPS